jgi:Zn-dependent protease with chaperone function
VGLLWSAAAAIAICNPRLQREELAADRYAAELIGAEAVLVWLHAMAERHPPGPEPSWFAARLTTHPSLRRRIAELTTGSAPS